MVLMLYLYWGLTITSYHNQRPWLILGVNNNLNLPQSSPITNINIHSPPWLSMTININDHKHHELTMPWTITEQPPWICTSGAAPPLGSSSRCRPLRAWMWRRRWKVWRRHSLVVAGRVMLRFAARDVLRTTGRSRNGTSLITIMKQLIKPPLMQRSLLNPFRVGGQYDSLFGLCLCHDWELVNILAVFPGVPRWQALDPPQPTSNDY